MADARDLGSRGVIRAGSTPVVPTNPDRGFPNPPRETCSARKPSKPPVVSKLTPLSPGESHVRKGLSVFTHAATDDGSAFLVKIDGVFIYHAGDHALWVEELLPAFTKELKGIKAKAGEIDLAFIPAARGMFTQCAVDSTIEKGVSLCVEILQPKVVALQHIGCDDKLFQYEQTRKKLAGKNARWISPVKYNSSFW